jgi:hypothetical protein
VHQRWRRRSLVCPCPRRWLAPLMRLCLLPLLLLLLLLRSQSQRRRLHSSRRSQLRRSRHQRLTCSVTICLVVRGAAMHGAALHVPLFVCMSVPLLLVHTSQQGMALGGGGKSQRAASHAH